MRATESAELPDDRRTVLLVVSLSEGKQEGKKREEVSVSERRGEAEAKAKAKEGRGTRRTLLVQ